MKGALVTNWMFFVLRERRLDTDLTKCFGFEKLTTGVQTYPIRLFDVLPFHLPYDAGADAILTKHYQK